jgi:hypothetical protein
MVSIGNRAICSRRAGFQFTHFAALLIDHSSVSPYLILNIKMLNRTTARKSIVPAPLRVKSESRISQEIPRTEINAETNDAGV